MKAFKQAGISISPDGTENPKLFVCGLPDIIVGPWRMEDSIDMFDSDEEVEYTSMMVAAEAHVEQIVSHPCLGNKSK